MYKIKNSKTKKSSLKKVVVATLLVLLLIAAGVGYALLQKSDDGNQNQQPDDTFVNYDPPTEKEQESGNEQKEEIVENNTPKEDAPDAKPNENNDSNKKSVSVIISYAGQEGQTIEVNSFVPDHIQDGTCTVTFTKGSKKLTKTVPAYADASSSICTNPEIKKSEFPETGNWQVAVTYESKDAMGTSEPREIRIN